jgi:hypothetical protein
MFFLFGGHLTNCVFLILIDVFSNEPELGVKIDPGMSFTPFLSKILDETRFEPTAF